MSKGIVMGPFNYDEQNGYLEILFLRFWGRRGGQVALQSFWSLKKGTKTFHFSLNEPSHDIL